MYSNLTLTALEIKVNALNNWLDNHHTLHHLYRKKKHERDFYVAKMCEYELPTIEI